MGACLKLNPSRVLELAIGTSCFIKNERLQKGYEVIPPTKKDEVDKKEQENKDGN